MEPVRIVRQVFFPLDEELALLPGSLTPKHQEHLTHLGSWMPFERAAQMMETLLDIQVSEPSTREPAIKPDKRSKVSSYLLPPQSNRQLLSNWS